METKNSFLLKAALAMMLLASLGCKKEKIQHNEITPSQTQTLTTGVLGRINLEDVVAQLPQSILYNLGNNAKLDLDHVEWTNTEDHLLARIPTYGSKGYVYVMQQNSNPADIKAYLVKFVPDAGFNENRFSGKQIWIDLQDWHFYGIEYKDDLPVAYLTPTKAARADWEGCAQVTSHLRLNPSTGFYDIDNDPVSPWGLPNYKCPGEGSFWNDLKNFFSDVGDWIGDLFGGESEGGSNTPGNSNTGTWTGGAIGGGGYGGGFGTGGNGGVPGGGSGYGGGNWHGPNPGNLEEGNGSPIYVSGTRGEGNVSIDPNALKKGMIAKRLNTLKGAFDEWSFQDVPANSPHMTAQEFQDLLNYTGTIDPPNVFNASPTTKTVRFHTWGTPWSGMDFFINLQFNNGLWEYVSANSNLWGVSFPAQWEQTNVASSVTGNLLKIEIEGYNVYSVFVEGIGTVYRSYRRYVYYGNNVTGATISFDRVD